MSSVVYRAFDAADRLLYVGVTADPYRRFSVHEWQTYFWWRVERIEVSQEFEDRSTAEDAERKAIRDYKPKFNAWIPMVPPRAEAIELRFGPYEYVNNWMPRWMA